MFLLQDKKSSKKMKTNKQKTWTDFLTNNVFVKCFHEFRIYKSTKFFHEKCLVLFYTLFVTSKNRNHQFTNLKGCKKPFETNPLLKVYYFLLYALFMTSKIEFFNSLILQFKVLQNALKIKKQCLKYFLK